MGETFLVTAIADEEGLRSEFICQVFHRQKCSLTQHHYLAPKGQDDLRDTTRFAGHYR